MCNAPPLPLLPPPFPLPFFPPKTWHWMWDVISMNEEKLIQHGGLDGAVFVRFFVLYIQVRVTLVVQVTKSR